MNGLGCCVFFVFDFFRNYKIHTNTAEKLKKKIRKIRKIKKITDNPDSSLNQDGFCNLVGRVPFVVEGCIFIALVDDAVDSRLALK